MTEKSIFESAQVFKELIDNMKSGVTVYEAYNNGEDFLIKDINKSGEKIANVKRNDILGKILTETFPGIKEFGLFKVLQQVWKTGKSERHPVSMYKDERISAYAESYVYKLPSGHIVAIYDDVSENKKTGEQLRESEERFRKIFEESPLGMALIKLDDNSIIKVNSMLCNMLGYNEKELVGLTITEITHPEDVETDMELLKKLVRGEIPFFTLEKRYIKKDKQIMWGNLTGSITRDNDENPLYGIGMIADITERKETESKLKESEEELLKLNRDLEKIVEERTEELKASDDMYRKAYNQVNLYKDIFAHDINNILQNIHSSVELSSLYINSPDKLHTIKELYEIINEQVNRGKKLIKNIKKITEIDETDIELEKINATLELNKAIEFTRASFPNRNLNIQFETKVKRMYILANKLLLDVFENILINAVRHNDKSNIQIIIDVDKETVEDKEYIKIEFKDNGLGISDYRKKDIFEKGTRTTQKSKGMGLGLSLVKKIVDGFHGDIWIEDRIKGDHKQGCNFVVLLQKAE